MTLAELVKIARRKYGYSLRDVQEKCGVSNAYLSQIETGKVQNPSAHILRSLVVAFPFYEKEILMTQGIIGHFDDQI